MEQEQGGQGESNWFHQVSCLILRQSSALTWTIHNAAVMKMRAAKKSYVSASVCSFVFLFESKFSLKVFQFYYGTMRWNIPFNP